MGGVGGGGRGGGEVRQRLVSERPRSRMRLLLGRSPVLPVLERVDRAVCYNILFFLR